MVVLSWRPVARVLFVFILTTLLFRPGYALAADFLSVPGDENWLRGISADGSTAIGETADGAFRWRPAVAVGVEFLNPGSVSTAHGLSADGNVIVGGTLAETLLPYRWSALTGMQPLASATDGRGIALGVSADGGVVVGEFGQPPGFDASACGFMCTYTDDGSVHAFRWDAVDGVTALADSSVAAGSSAVEVSADGLVVAINSFDYPMRQCSPNIDGACVSPVRRQLVPYRALGEVLENLSTTLQSGDFLTSISADGSTLTGIGNDRQAFRWRTDSFYQPLVRRTQYPQPRPDTVARAASADGAVVAGNFGVWQFGRAVDLKNLLVNGLNLPLTGWRFDSLLRSDDQDFTGRIPIFGGAGVTGVSADGLRWSGTALDPMSVVRGFVVELDEPVSLELGNSLPPIANDALLSAVLPAARTVTVGETVTVFASVINNSAVGLRGCGFTLGDDLPLSVQSWRYDLALGEVIGDASSTFSLAPGEVQTLLVALTPQAPFTEEAVELVADCGNTQRLVSRAGLNTLYLRATEAPAPDVVIALATDNEFGYAFLNDESVGAFALATTNLGAAASSVRLAAFESGMPVDVMLCETEAATGLCKSPPVEGELLVDFPSGQSRTFAVFLRSFDTLPPDPFFNRLFLLFFEGGEEGSASGDLLGLTSIAVADERLVNPFVQTGVRDVVSQ